MIYQTDARNSQAFQHFGCYFSDLLKLSENVLGTDFDFDKVNAIYNAAISAGFVGYMVGEKFYPGENANPLDGCFVQSALDVLHLAGTAKAEILMGPLSAGMWPIDAQIPENTGIIQKWHNDRTGFSHFVVGNPDGSVQWDPINYSGQGSVTVREGTKVSLRLVKFL